jgi:CRISPR/Cas system-associated exonuclease Cas4 (RecB family)
MTWEEHDSLVHFNQAFDEEVAKDVEKSGVQPSAFRAGGRVSKAYPNKEDESWWRANGPHMVDAWIEWRAGIPNWQIWETPAGKPAIEMEMNATVGGVPVKAFLDRIFIDVGTGELNLVDLKTGSREPDNPLQLGFYRVLVLKTLGVEVNTGYYWMARKGGLSQPHDLTRFDEHLIGSMLRQFEKAVREEVFIPHLSSSCNTCGVNRACYAFGGAEAQQSDPLHPQYSPVIRTLEGESK